jgi:hypothetical protein
MKCGSDGLATCGAVLQCLICRKSKRQKIQKIRAWSLIRNKKPIVLFESHCHATEKSEAIACARRCRSSRLTRRWTKKNNWKKWRAKEEERHKGLLTPPKIQKNWIHLTHPDSLLQGLSNSHRHLIRGFVIYGNSLQKFGLHLVRLG